MEHDEREAEEPREDEPSDGALGGKPKKKAPWKRDPLPWALLGILVALILLVGWTKVVRSDSFCARCHSMQAAAETAANSAHADVSCISCHRGYGLKGAVLYIPTFLREVAQQFGGVPVANGVMDPAPCDKCHTTIFSSQLLKGEHPSTGCSDCHGDPSHPKPVTLTVSPFDPHPSTWVQTHGREAVKSAQTCATCHLPNFCMATCHFKFADQFPHPDNWISIHGPQQQLQGPEACALCHPPTFCASCHGTEIPHAPDWLSQHYLQLQNGYPTTPCLLCHAPTDCNNCHARHGIHNAQTVYAR